MKTRRWLSRGEKEKSYKNHKKNHKGKSYDFSDFYDFLQFLGVCRNSLAGVAVS